VNVSLLDGQLACGSTMAVTRTAQLEIFPAMGRQVPEAHIVCGCRVGGEVTAVRTCRSSVWRSSGVPWRPLLIQ
jgi:hypothetical protein